MRTPCEPSLLPDPAFPRLGDAFDAGVMLTKFREHPPPTGKMACVIAGCLLSDIRHREGERCILQYTPRVSKAGSQNRRVDR